MKQILIYIIGLIIFLFISIIVYWYFNPTIDNKDFDIEYKISNNITKYYKERNYRYSDDVYTFNHDTYYNKNQDKLIIHSLDKDIISGKEKVIFIIKRKSDPYPIAIVDYMDKNNELVFFKIKYKKDTIFLYRKPFLDEKESLFFYGIRNNRG